MMQDNGGSIQGGMFVTDVEVDSHKKVMDGNRYLNCPF